MRFHSSGKLLALSLALGTAVSLYGFHELSIAADTPQMQWCEQKPHLALPRVALPRDLERVMDSVVIVQNGAEIGSGVIVSESGYILTAAHLLHLARRVAIYLSSGEVQTAQVLRLDTLQDIALLKISGRSYACLPMMEEALPLGSQIFAIGFLPEKNARFVIREGKIQAYEQSYETGGDATVELAYIRTDMALQPGSSGGPLLDAQGRLVGIISGQAQPKMRSDNRPLKHMENSSASFSVPASAATKWLQSVWRKL